MIIRDQHALSGLGATNNLYCHATDGLPKIIVGAGDTIYKNYYTTTCSISYLYSGETEKWKSICLSLFGSH